LLCCSTSLQNQYLCYLSPTQISFPEREHSLQRYFTTSSRSCPSIYTPFRTIGILHPSLRSQRRAVHSLSGCFGLIPRSGKIVEARARCSLHGVTSPAF